MLLHRNEACGQKNFEFRRSYTNHVCKRERATVMTSISSSNQKISPEYLFKCKGVRIKSILQVLQSNGLKKDPTEKKTSRIFPCKKTYILTRRLLCTPNWYTTNHTWGITGNVQGNDTDFHHPLKPDYRKLEMELMLVKLRQHPERIPSPSREEMMATFDKSWSTVCANLDAANVFKKNMITLNFDGTEEHEASQKLISLAGKEMFWFREKLLISNLASSIQALNA